MNTKLNLVKDLKKVGVSVTSVWDLVNGPNNYDAAQHVLIKYLQTDEDLWFKEGIVRALGVKGFNDAIPYLLKEYKNSNDELYKWAIGNTIANIKPKEALNELIEIMGDRKHGSARQMIAEALGRIGDKASVPVLIESLDDEEVAGHAVVALGLIGDESAIEKINPFLNHEMRWIRKAAEKAIKKIEKKTRKTK